MVNGTGRRRSHAASGNLFYRDFHQNILNWGVEPVAVEESTLQEQPFRANRPYTEEDFGRTAKLGNFRMDLRAPNPKHWNQFIKDTTVRDWSTLTWSDAGRPYRVENYAQGKLVWEDQHQSTLPVKTSWQYFNQSFHSWFVKDVPAERKRLHSHLAKSLLHLQFGQVAELVEEYEQLGIWNLSHRMQDAIWDPRGKRALFEGLQLDRPRILFLGAADGYEAMQLYSMYPGGEVVLVDYDEFCKTDRFGKFPGTYPFLGVEPGTDRPRVWYKEEMNIDFLVDDIRNLPFGQEFDVVVSVGLIEHFPDEHKPEAIAFHRQFLKPGGYAILTTPRLQWKSRLFYHVMAEAMNYTYRELMTVAQMGLYVYENGFDILRHGTIKAHNGIIARPR
jgi:hypothetical protein